MERVARHRKTFDEKQNDHKHLNKKPNMMASLNYKSTGHQNPLKILPRVNNIPCVNNIQFYESVATQQQQPEPYRPSLTLSTLPHQYRKSLLPPVSEMSNSKAYTKIYHETLSAYFGEFLGDEPIQFLRGHQVTSSLRARMLDWMVEVTESYKFTSKTYFAGVEIMDRYFAEENMTIPVEKLHIIGVAAMLISSKMEEVYPFRLKTIYEKIVHKKISCKDLVETESEIFEKLGFNTVTATFFDKIMLQLYTLSIQENKLETSAFRDQKALDELETYCVYISKFACYSYEILTGFSKQIIADSVIGIALEVLGISASGILENLGSFIQVQQCKAMLKGTISNFKRSFKGLANLHKFADEEVAEKIDLYLA